MQKKYLLKGLDCPNCAAAIEEDVGRLPHISASSVNLMKQSLVITTECDDDDLLFSEIESVVHSHEPDVSVKAMTDVRADRIDKDADEEEEGAHRVPRLIVGACIYAIVLLLYHLDSISFTVYLSLLILDYVLLGYDVIFTALRNLIRGNLFDENFLMTISTIGAFGIGEYPEAVAVMLFYQVGEYFQDRAVDQSRRSISTLLDIRPDTAHVKRDSEYVTVPSPSVSIGDHILVRPGERIPLDGIVRSGESLVDTRALTGESVPRRISAGDEALSGCINEHGALEIEVTKNFSDSTASRIIDLVENAASRKAPMERFITRFCRYYTPAVVIAALALGIVPPLLFQASWAEWLNRAFVFLVISCPCALVVSTPLSFFGGIGAASKNGILVKGSNYLEALTQVDTIVFDKTGTLTKGVFDVQHIETAQGLTKDEVLSMAAAAESRSTHPVAHSIVKAYGKSISDTAITSYEEVFGQGIKATVHGDVLLCGNEKLLTAHNVPFTPSNKAGTKVYVAKNGHYCGCIYIADEEKEDSAKAIADLKAHGITRTVMLTGDDESIASAMAKRLGLDSYFAQLLPEEKLEKLEELDRTKGSGKKLAFVGDGINDAPVLARADVGIAMGGVGSDAAIEAADIVLMTDEPSKLIKSINIASVTKRIASQNIVFALAIKGLLLLLGAFGLIGMWEAVFGDVGVMVLAVLNAMRALRA